MATYDADKALAWLRSLSALSELDERQLGPLATAMGFLRIPAGRAFIQEGSIPDFVYVVREGEIEIRVEKPDQDAASEGADVLAADRVLRAGSLSASGDETLLVGLVGLVDLSARSASCVARTDLDVARLPIAAVRMEMESGPDIRCAFRYAIARQLARDARGLNDFLHARLPGAKQGK